MILNLPSLRATNKAFNAKFKKAFASVTPAWTKVAMKTISKTASNSYAWLGQTTMIREWLGDRQLQNLQAHDYTIKNKDFEGTVVVPVNALKDDEEGLFGPSFEGLGHSASIFPDELVFSLLLSGFKELCFDGKPFFSESHPVGLQGKTKPVSNMVGGKAVPWFLLDTSRPIKPLIYQEREPFKMVAMDSADDEAVFNKKELRYGVDGRMNAGFGLWQLAFASKTELTPESFDTARTKMRQFKSDNGKPLGVKPTLLVVGPSNETAAKKLISNEYLPNGENNIYHKSVEVLVVDWLD